MHNSSFNFSIPIVFSLLCVFIIGACSKSETYADQKKKERNAINSFIGRDVSIVDSEGDTIIYVGHINSISEQQFIEQDSVTDVSKNEYVLFSNTGIYMQIVRQGAGEKLANGESKRILARYLEYNILGDSIQSRNTSFYYHTNPDIIEIANSYGTFTASFSTDNGGGAMYHTYSRTEVPSGWLVPFTYIRIGRQIEGDDHIAKVRLIVPHTSGTYDARQSVYPCFYELTFQEMRD